MFLLLLKELIIVVLAVVTAAGVVPCGSPEKRPHTSSKVLFIFYFWLFEISRNILRNQKILYVQTACLVVNPITVGNFSFLFNCTLVGQTSDLMTAPT